MSFGDFGDGCENLISQSVFLFYCFKEFAKRLGDIYGASTGTLCEADEKANIDFILIKNLNVKLNLFYHKLIGCLK